MALPDLVPRTRAYPMPATTRSVRVDLVEMPTTLRNPFPEWLLLHGRVLVEGAGVVFALAGRAHPHVNTSALRTSRRVTRMRPVNHDRTPCVSSGLDHEC